MVATFLSLVAVFIGLKAIDMYYDLRTAPPTVSRNPYVRKFTKSTFVSLETKTISYRKVEWREALHL